jgi:UDP-N-acetylglucosamine diphosphorylase/glucosamine-1-phosphate N-acetyltransferase
VYVGRGSQVLGDRVSNSSIGDHCRVHGELSSTIVLGHSNKTHTGFVGHSYLGRWVNLGALTTTSNLKNTYGPVQLWTPTGLRSTGQQFLGTLFGDHVKTGIGTMLSTGSVLGAGANIFGANMPPRVVPPFAWGDSEPYDTYDVTKFLAVAERVMSRRQVELGANGRLQLTEAHKKRWSIG